MLGVEPGALEVARREVDDDDVGARREVLHHTVAGGDHLLGAVRVAPQRFVVRRHVGRRVDAEHPRAVLPEVHRRDRAGRVDREVQHRHVTEGALQRRQEFPIECSSMFAIFLRASSRLAGSHSDGHRPSTGL